MITMVTTAVRKSHLQKLVGKKLSEQQLETALHQIKAPIDSVEGDELQIEVTGDRPDLLSAEGIARALKGYLGIERGIPEEKFERGGYVLHVDENVKQVREFIVAAVVENLSISEDDFKDLIQIQEKLTLTHGRKRKKVAIGLHDMASLVPPFYYKAVAPEGVEFVPLMKSQKMNLRQILEKHEKGIEYGWILKDSPKYPIIFDSRNQVLSFPPIINGILTEMTTSTKTIFIDITGTDFHACNTALNILCQDFFDRGAKVKTVEIREGGKTVVTPETAPEKMELKVAEANKLLGTTLKGTEIITALEKQRISAKLKDATTLECLIPRYRADFLHPVDLIEEVALGYGYNNFEPKPPSVFTKGGLTSRTKLMDALSDLMAGAGYLQINNPILTNDNIFKRALSKELPIIIKNPVSEEYENIRNSLLPPMLETLSRNMHNPYPQKAFELGFIAREKLGSEFSASNELHIAAAIAGAQANISDITGVLMELLRRLRVPHKLNKADIPTFIKGRQAAIMAEIEGSMHQIAVIGEISPLVLENLKLEVPVAAFEMDLEPFVK